MQITWRGFFLFLFFGFLLFWGFFGGFFVVGGLVFLINYLLSPYCFGRCKIFFYSLAFSD